MKKIKFKSIPCKYCSNQITSDIIVYIGGYPDLSCVDCEAKIVQEFKERNIYHRMICSLDPEDKTLSEKLITLIKKSWLYSYDDDYVFNQEINDFVVTFFKVIAGRHEIVAIGTDERIYPNIIINNKYLLRKFNDGVYLLMTDSINTVVDITEASSWEIGNIKKIMKEFDHYQFLSEGIPIVRFY